MIINFAFRNFDKKVQFLELVIVVVVVKVKVKKEVKEMEEELHHSS